VVDAIAKEIELRRDYLPSKNIETIYFGGGTPSLLSRQDLSTIFEKLKEHFQLQANAEITLEANPDDFNEALIGDWLELGINRLSVGIQSFHNPTLEWMNRTHQAEDAQKAMKMARKAGFKNISIDLIYGIPTESHAIFQANVEKALSLKPEHISSYCLTIEPKTAFGNWVEKRLMEAPDDDYASEQYLFLVQSLQKAGYLHYEVSNFARDDHFSKHNSSYWLQKPYLGLGPSAHSFNGISRQWQASNNARYVKSINAGETFLEKEILSLDQRFTEYLLTRLRTIWGVDYSELIKTFKKDSNWEGWALIDDFKNKNWLEPKSDKLVLNEQGMLMADHIVSSFINLNSAE
jgi:oxygen-independent coproporphyrinogen-3 oxidase